MQREEATSREIESNGYDEEEEKVRPNFCTSSRFGELDKVLFLSFFLCKEGHLRKGALFFRTCVGGGISGTAEVPTLRFPI